MIQIKRTHNFLQFYIKQQRSDHSVYSKMKQSIGFLVRLSSISLTTTPYTYMFIKMYPCTILALIVSNIKSDISVANSPSLHISIYINAIIT